MNQAKKAVILDKANAGKPTAAQELLAMLTAPKKPAIGSKKPALANPGGNIMAGAFAKQATIEPSSPLKPRAPGGALANLARSPTSKSPQAKFTFLPGGNTGTGGKKKAGKKNVNSKQAEQEL